MKRLLVFLILTFSLSALADEAETIKLSGKTCSINTMSMTCNVPTGCFDEDSFTNETRSLLEQQLKSSGFNLIKSRSNPEFYDAEFVVELKSKAQSLSIKIYKKELDGSVSTAFLLEQSHQQAVNVQAAQMIKKIPSCEIE